MYIELTVRMLKGGKKKNKNRKKNVRNFGKEIRFPADSAKQRDKIAAGARRMGDAYLVRRVSLRCSVSFCVYIIHRL